MRCNIRRKLALYGTFKEQISAHNANENANGFGSQCPCNRRKAMQCGTEAAKPPEYFLSSTISPP